uniref:Large ribosomal subunit protein uL2m n=1 Tax=Nephromyces sp. ex Molgula occidentalis TaxID=2544991 RepID=A0A5C1H951_9APIC|nr:50S ribosomal protein L2 [Nephromyces sp. ex Molgula occidentalis]
MTIKLNYLNLKWQKSFGKNNTGKITSRFRGGGFKNIYKSINMNYANYGQNSTYAICLNKYYNPYKKGYILMIQYLNGLKIGLYDYILYIKSLTKGDIISFNSPLEHKIGNSKPLKNIIIGSIICNIECKPGQGAKLVKSFGTEAKLLSLDLKYAWIKLPSGEIRLVSNKCFATIGSIQPKSHILKKAGDSRFLHKRPHIRGVAMNAVDHPHGGGEGKSGIGRKTIWSPWKKIKFKTRKIDKYSNKFILIRKNMKYHG